METITAMITAIATMLAKPKSEKKGLIRQLRKTKKQSQKLYFKMKRKIGKNPSAYEEEQLKQLWDNIMDLSDEIENINN